METSKKKADRVVPAVEYPSAKPPVHPLKLETRKAIQTLTDMGVKVRQSGRGFPGVFSLVKHAPELLEEIIEAARSTDERGKLVWSELLSTHYTMLDADSTVYVFTLDLQIARLATERMKPGSKYAMDAIRSVTSVIRQVKDVRPDTKDFALIISAYEVYSDILGRVSGSFIDRRQKNINKHTIGDIEFIAENLDAVKSIAPALKKRGTVDQRIIVEMLEARTLPLLDGIL